MKPPPQARRAILATRALPRRTRAFRRAGLFTRVFAALIVAVAAGCQYGCGVQGTPHPPRLERPATIPDFKAAQVGQGLDLHFTLPQQTTEGTRLTKPLELEILRALAPQTRGMSKLPQSEVWLRLTREEWLPHSRGNEISYVAHLTELEFREWRGRNLVFTVRSLTRGFHHRPPPVG